MNKFNDINSQHNLERLTDEEFKQLVEKFKQEKQLEYLIGMDKIFKKASAYNPKSKTAIAYSKIAHLTDDERITYDNMTSIASILKNDEDF